MAVIVGHEGPGNAKDPGIAGKWAFGELGKLTVVTGGQAAADLVELGFDQVVVVDKPLSGMGQLISQFEFSRAGQVGG